MFPSKFIPPIKQWREGWVDVCTATPGTPQPAVFPDNWSCLHWDSHPTEKHGRAMVSMVEVVWGQVLLVFVGFSGKRWELGWGNHWRPIPYLKWRVNLLPGQKRCVWAGTASPHLWWARYPRDSAGRRWKGEVGQSRQRHWGIHLLGQTN